MVKVSYASTISYEAGLHIKVLRIQNNKNIFNKSNQYDNITISKTKAL